MKNLFVVYIAVISIMISSCATSHKQAKSAVTNKSQTQETTLSEDDKNEFQYTFIEALKQKMIGNQQAAVTLLSKCLDINPNSTSAMFELAKIHSGNGDQTSSSLLLEKAINLSPDNKWFNCWKKLNVGQVVLDIPVKNRNNEEPICSLYCSDINYDFIMRDVA